MNANPKRPRVSHPQFPRFLLRDVPSPLSPSCTTTRVSYLPPLLVGPSRPLPWWSLFTSRLLSPPSQPPCSGREDRPTRVPCALSWKAKRFRGLAWPSLAFASLRFACLRLPALRLPCLAFACLALPCFPLPCLRFPCLPLSSLAFGSARFGSARFGSLRFPSLPFAYLRLHSLRLPCLPFASLPSPSLPTASLCFASLSFACLRFRSLPLPSLRFPSLPFACLPFACLRLPCLAFRSFFPFLRCPSLRTSSLLRFASLPSLPLPHPSLCMCPSHPRTAHAAPCPCPCNIFLMPMQRLSHARGVRPAQWCEAPKALPLKGIRQRAAVFVLRPCHLVPQPFLLLHFVLKWHHTGTRCMVCEHGGVHVQAMPGRAAYP